MTSAAKAFRSVRLLAAAGLALALSLSACSGPAPIAAPPAQTSQSTPAATQNMLPAKSAPKARIDITPGASGKPVLRFSIDFPAAGGFSTQALDCTSFARYQVSVRGIGMAAPLYPAEADEQQSNTIASPGCHLETTIADVPSGKNRLALLSAYDDEGAVVPGSTLAAVFDVSSDPTTVYLSLRSTPAGQVIAQWLPEATNDPEQLLMLAQLDNSELQDLIDGLTGATDEFPDLFPNVHPANVDVDAILAALIAAGGDAGALSPGVDEDFVLTPASVSGSVTGLVSDDTVSLRLSDPATGAIIDLDNQDFSFSNVPPGTWELIVTAPEGYTVSEIEPIVVTEGATIELEPIVLTPTQPTLTSIGAETGVAGDVLVITGEDFHPDPAGNTVVIGGVTIPSANIVVNEDQTELQVTLPEDLPFGDTEVEVSVGSQTATNSPDFDVLPPAPLSPESDNIDFDSFDLNWEPVLAGSEHEVLYNVYQDGVLITLTPQAGTSISLTGLSSGTLYPMEVSAVVDGVESERVPIDVRTLSPTGWSLFSGSESEHVLAVASSAEHSSHVYFGAKTGSAGHGGIWRCVSNDACVQVKSETEAGSVQALAINPDDPYLIYAGSETQGVFLNIAAGAAGQWIQSNTGLSGGALNVRAIAVDPIEPSKVYIGTQSGVYLRDFSQLNSSWAHYSSELLSFDVYSLAIYRPNQASDPVLYAGTLGDGVFRKVGSGNWATINTGLFEESSGAGDAYLDAVNVTALAPHPTNSALLYGGGTGEFSIGIATWKVGIWRRTENGSSSDWDQIARNGVNGYPCPLVTPSFLQGNVCTPVSDSTGLSSMKIHAIAVDPITPSIIYTATGQDNLAGGIYYSTNSGSSWSKLGTAITNATTLAANGAHLYAGTPTGVYIAN